jgi:hypothetical protein
MNAFGKEFEVVNQLFHIGFHIHAGGWRYLVVVAHHWTGISTQPSNALLHNPIGLEYI